MTVRLTQPANPPTLPWYEQLALIVNALVSSGTTANRPTKFLWLGRRYWDEDLDKPVYVKSIGPPVVWVDGVGSVS